MVFWSIVLLFKDRNNFRKISKIWAGSYFNYDCSALGVSEISIIKPIVIKLINDRRTEKWGYSVATSSRSYLADIYLNDFENYSLCGKLFGSFIPTGLNYNGDIRS